VHAILTARGFSDALSVFRHASDEPMNRRVYRQIFIALGVFAGIVLVFVLIAHFGG
jgi:hypothetical protein